MARPTRNDVDYFPFMCKEGKGMFVIEEKYGNNGFATWIKILRSLATTNFHYLNLSDPSEKMFLSAKCKVSQDVLESIIDDLINLGEFDRELWEGFSILYSEKFIESIKDAYTKRNNSPLSKKQLLSHLSSLGVIKPSKGIPKPSLEPLKGVDNPQSKVEYSKVEEKKREEKKDISFFNVSSSSLLSDEVWFKNMTAELVGKFPHLHSHDVFSKFSIKWSSYLFYCRKYKLTFADEKHIKNSFKKFALQYWFKTQTQLEYILK
jgi:hypothetical protein